MMRHLLLITALAAVSPAWACEGITAKDAWLREAPPGATVMAGYVTLVNNSDTPRTLREIRSKDFGAIEFHRTVTENGESRMQMLDNVALPARQSTSLQPGGMHLMMFRVARPLKAGDSVKLNLYCGRKHPLRVDFAVRAAP